MNDKVPQLKRTDFRNRRCMMALVSRKALKELVENDLLQITVDGKFGAKVKPNEMKKEARSEGK